MTNAILTRLTSADWPWAYSLRIHVADRDQFQAFIDDLKRHILSRDRRWDAIEKRWLLRECDVALYLLERHRLTYVCDDEQPTHRQIMSRDMAAKTLYLLPNAPPAVVNAVYKVLAKQAHPDHGGDTATMQALNLAVEVLRGEQ